MKQPLIRKSANNGYVSRITFRFDELLASLPEEMLAAKKQIPNCQCYGLFYVNSFKTLKCKVKKPEETFYRFYLWSHTNEWIND
jgi:hypothetical protein